MPEKKPAKPKNLKFGRTEKPGLNIGERGSSGSKPSAGRKPATPPPPPPKKN